VIKPVTAVLIGIFLISCSNRQNSQNDPLKSDTTTSVVKKDTPDTTHSEKFVEISGDSVLILPFEIAVTLSPKAEEKMKQGKETAIVFVFFTGTPKDSAAAHFEEDGSFFVTSARKEIVYGEVARFDSIKFSKEIYDQLADKDIDLGINVYSGRKSSENNLLDCESLFDKISYVVNKRFTIKCKLIYGDD